MYLKSVFPTGSTKWLSAKWLPERRAFLDFARKCWKADTDETREIFNAGDRIMYSMFRLFLNSPTLVERYATCFSTHSTETKSHAS